MSTLAALSVSSVSYQSATELIAWTFKPEASAIRCHPLLYEFGLTPVHITAPLQSLRGSPSVEGRHSRHHVQWKFILQLVSIPGGQVSSSIAL